MSFIRPEVLATAQKHQRHLIAAGFALIGAYLLWQGLAGPAPVLTGLGGVILAVTLTLTIAERQRARFRRVTAQPGIVEVKEAQISYFGPDTGGVVDRDGLTRVDLVSWGDGLAYWRLSHDAGGPVHVPLSAEGADRLVDVLMTLPGINITAALTALNRRHKAIVPVWSRTDR